VTDLVALDLARSALTMTLMLAGPLLAVGLVVGLVVSLLQALTQINEVTLSFVPKILAVFAALAVAGPWLLTNMLNYTVGLFNMLPSMAR
jgi:flagellar biosynthetic protein FliQ